ncbi:cytochrome P450 6B6-like [Leguminivora glycinivorella]|uniref:cytochrome P450 6B6-like n=1 Tax=Leguminivora glycinivorella TaxID=1035111 RepID=UPI00200FD81B|nr:cytochrome P450 6B6-like [Leguminivora glycinivorella]
MIVVLLAVLVIAIYYFGTRNHDYWAKRNVKHDPPVFLFGNNYKGFVGQQSITQVANDLYNRFPNEKVVGFYRGSTPELYIRDPDIIRDVLNTDFAYFYSRGFGRDPKVEPLSANLFSAEGDLWKLLRQRITPAFTTAKLKAMFPLVVRSAERLQGVARDVAVRSDACDVRELMARYTTEFIGACGFGVDADSLGNENSAFRNIGRMIFATPLPIIIKQMLYQLFPPIRSFLHVGNPKLREEIFELVKTIRENRQCKPSGRHDFIDLLLELETKGKIVGESVEHRNADGTPLIVDMEMDVKMMAAQVFVFFGAGFETSSSATSFLLHQLAYNPEIQAKIQSEIDEVLQKYDNKLCYDAVAEMTLLGMAFKEGMRMFPSLGVLNRVCARTYTFPQLGLTIDPGVKIVIPVEALQNDEKYFDNPREFRPERFTPEEIQKRHKYVYLPFGDGPRACIGLRLGEMQSLAGLAAVLQQCCVSPVGRDPACAAAQFPLERCSGCPGGIATQTHQQTIKN